MTDSVEQNPGAVGGVKKGAMWMVLARLAETGIGIANTAILARLLSPGDFGLMALCASTMAAIEVIGAFGFDWALVRQPSLKRTHMDTAWTLRLIIGFFSGLLLVAIATPVAAYYAEPRMEFILPVLGAAVFFTCCENPGIVMFRRNFDFAKEFTLRTAPKLATICVTIPIAIYTRSWQALLGGILIGRIASSAVSYWMHDFRPRLSLAASRELLSFSVWLSANNILDFLRLRFSTLVTAKLLDNRSVGLLSVSMDLANLAITELAAPINRAVFSKYAALSKAPHAIGAGFLVAGPTIWMLALPLATGIGLSAKQIIYILLGPTWLDGVPVLQILAIAGGLNVMSANTAYVFWAIGKSRIVTILTFVSVAVLVPTAIILTFHYGLVGVATAYVLSAAVALPLSYVFLAKSAAINFSTFVGRTWRIVLATGVMALTVNWFSQSLTPTSVLSAAMQLAAIALVGIFSYLACLSMMWLLLKRPAGAEQQAVDALMLIAKRLTPTHH